MKLRKGANELRMSDAPLANNIELRGVKELWVLNSGDS